MEIYIQDVSHRLRQANRSRIRLSWIPGQAPNDEIFVIFLAKCIEAVFASCRYAAASPLGPIRLRRAPRTTLRVAAARSPLWAKGC